MLKKSCKLFFGAIIIASLLACSSHVQPIGKIAVKSRDDFMTAMRWKQYGIAAGFLQQEEDRDHFITTFRELKDLHITDVRMVDLKDYEGGKRFRTTMEMDYYLPPSVTLETFTFDQTWVFFDGENPMGRGFLIVTPFPEFP